MIREHFTLQNCVPYLCAFNMPSRKIGTPVFEVQIIFKMSLHVQHEVIKCQIQRLILRVSSLQTSNYKAHSSYLNVKYHSELTLLSRQSWINLWSSFSWCIFPLSEAAKTFWTRRYLRLFWQMWYRVLLKVAQMLASSHTFNASHCAPCALARWCRLVPFLFVFSARTTYFRFVPHNHWQVLCVGNGCCDIDVMLPKI